MRRRGFALQGALWLVVLLGGIVATAFEEEAIAITATSNRIELIRAEWARFACWQIARARSENTDTPTSRTTGVRSSLDIDSLEVSSGRWCESRTTDLGARLNVNSAPETVLRCVVRERADAILMRRPLPNDEALWPLVDSTTSSRLTTYGDGRLNIHSASPEVLACLPGWNSRAANAMVSERSRGVRFTSIEQVLQALPLSIQDEARAEAPALMSLLTTESVAYLAEVIGHSGVHDLQTVMHVEVVASGNTWQVVRREVE